MTTNIAATEGYQRDSLINRGQFDCRNCVITDDHCFSLRAVERERLQGHALAEANPSVTLYEVNLASSYNNSGSLLLQIGRPTDARTAYENSRMIIQKLIDANPTVGRFQSTLENAWLGIGVATEEMGNAPEAAVAYRKSIVVQEQVATLVPVEKYNLAILHSRLAGVFTLPGSTLAAAENAAEADRAMAWFRKANDAGYRVVSPGRTDTDFAVLRSRLDFKLLMMDLVMPSDPFAP